MFCTPDLNQLSNSNVRSARSLKEPERCMLWLEIFSPKIVAKIKTVMMPQSGKINFKNPILWVVLYKHILAMAIATIKYILSLCMI